MGLSLFYVAFWDLQGDTNGMGGVIPWTAIHTYAQFYGYDVEQEEALHYHLKALSVAAQKFTKDSKAK